MDDNTVIFVTLIFLIAMIVVAMLFGDFLYCVAFVITTFAVIHICGIPE
jgi:hypothetical protein